MLLHEDAQVFQLGASTNRSKLQQVQSDIYRFKWNAESLTVMVETTLRNDYWVPIFWKFIKIKHG